MLLLFDNLVCITPQDCNATGSDDLTSNISEPVLDATRKRIADERRRVSLDLFYHIFVYSTN